MPWQVVVDLIAQKGLPFYKDMGEMLPGYYKGQPKPELTRIVLNTSKCTAATPFVLSHRAMELSAHVPLRSSGLGTTVFAAASASEDRENWGPPQVTNQAKLCVCLMVCNCITYALMRPPSCALVWDFVAPVGFVAVGGFTYSFECALS